MTNIVSIITSIFLFLFIPALANSQENALSFLKRTLGNELEIFDSDTIRYCPDNTCDIFDSGSSIKLNQLAEFSLLYLLYESSYVYLEKPGKEKESFKDLAKPFSSDILRKQKEHCSESHKTPKCIIQGMKANLGINISFARYDEGQLLIEKQN